MKRLIAIWGVGSLVVLMGLWAFGGEKVRGEKTKGLREKQLELDHSFAEVQVEIVELGLTPDEARDRIADWMEESQSEIVEVEQEKKLFREEALAELPKAKIPEEVPSRDAKTLGDFLDEVGMYFSEASRAIWDEVDASDQAQVEAAREQYARFMQSEQNLLLVKSAREARKEIRDSQIRRPPMSAAEIAELDPGERHEEEIYTRIYEVMFNPATGGEPTEAEEWRDRFAQLNPIIEEKIKQFRKEHPNQPLEKAKEEKRKISTQLDNLRDETK